MFGLSTNQPLFFSIHQPTEKIYTLLDHVGLLDTGFMIYLGPAKLATSWLYSNLSELSSDIQHKYSNYSKLSGSPDEVTFNSGEFLVELSHYCGTDRSVLKKIADASRRSYLEAIPDHNLQSIEVMATKPEELSDTVPMESVQSISEFKEKYRLTTIQEMLVLMSRSYRIFLSSRLVMISHILFTLSLGIGLSTIFQFTGLGLTGTQNKAGLFIFLLIMIGFSTLSCIGSYIEEQYQLKKEYKAGVTSILPYLLSKMLFDILPYHILPILVLIGLLYIPVGLRIDSIIPFLWFNEVLLVYSFITTGITILVVVIFNSFSSSFLISTGMVLFYIAFGGLWINQASAAWYLQVLLYLSPACHAFNAVMINELNGQLIDMHPYSSTGARSTRSVPLSGDSILYILGINASEFYLNVYILHLQAIIICILIYIALRVQLSK